MMAIIQANIIDIGMWIMSDTKKIAGLKAAAGVTTPEPITIEAIRRNMNQGLPEYTEVRTMLIKRNTIPPTKPPHIAAPQSTTCLILSLALLTPTSLGKGVPS
jgi:hypothetical protein